MLDYLHYKVRTTPWLGRLALKSIPNLNWHVNIDPIGRFAIHVREHRMFWLRPPLTNEGFMLGVLRRLIRQGDVVYDIGANIGLYCRFMVQCFKSSHVYAFEPVETNRLLIARNMAIAARSNQVTILPCAVADNDGTAEFEIDDLTSNTGALCAVTHGKASESRAQYGLPPVTTRVQIARLDTLIESQCLATPDVIKIDVEGAESMVLDGSRNLLSAHRPRLAIELHNADVGRSVLQTLWSYGYHCFGCLATEKTKPYRELFPQDLKRIESRYSLLSIAASPSAEDLAEPVEEFTSSACSL